jgi:hypothetical protein
MTDEQWIKSLAKISTPREMLAVIVDNEEFFGYDPYYAGLRKAMLSNAERVLGRESTEGR